LVAADRLKYSMRSGELCMTLTITSSVPLPAKK
jgi:hypothetical protein